MYKRFMRKLKGWKTILFNNLVIIIPMVVAVNPHSLNLNKEQLAWYTVAVTVANIWLRVVTTTPVGRKE